MTHPKKEEKRRPARSEGIDPEHCELGIIGFAIMNPAGSWQVATIKDVHFADEKRALIWNIANEAVSTRGTGITPQYIAERVARAGLLTVPEASALFVRAFDIVRDAADPERAGLTFADEVLDKSFRRAAHKCASKLRETADAAMSRDEIKHEVTQFLYGLANFETAASMRDLGEMLDEEVRNLDKKEDPSAGGLTTGIGPLDQMLLGMSPGDFVIVGSRPSYGKTSLGTQFAWRWAVDRGEAGLIQSLEMNKLAIIHRLLSQNCDIPLNKVRTKALDGGERARYIEGIERLKKAPIEIMDTKRLDGRVAAKTITDVVAEVRYWRNRMPLRWVVVDYIQLITAAVRIGENREREVAKVSTTLKQMASEMGLVVVALSQLRRPERDRAFKRPRLSDLRESGSLEQDADTVILIHNWDQARREHDDKSTGQFDGLDKGELILSKQRNGATGIARVTYLRTTQRFAEQEQATFGDGGDGSDVG